MFLKLNRAKVNFRSSLVFKRLKNNSRIMEEGSSWDASNLISAIKKWNIDKRKRTNEEKRLRN